MLEGGLLSGVQFCRLRRRWVDEVLGKTGRRECPESHELRADGAGEDVPHDEEGPLGGVDGRRCLRWQGASQDGGHELELRQQVEQELQVAKGDEQEWLGPLESQGVLE